MGEWESSKQTDMQTQIQTRAMHLPMEDEELWFIMLLEACCKSGQLVQRLLLADESLALAVAHLGVGQHLTGDRV